MYSIRSGQGTAVYYLLHVLYSVSGWLVKVFVFQEHSIICNCFFNSTGSQTNKLDVINLAGIVIHFFSYQKAQELLIGFSPSDIQI